MLTFIVIIALFVGQSVAQVGYEYLASCPIDACHPTVESSFYDATNDAILLCDMFGAMGTCQEKNIIDLLTSRTNSERLQIESWFPTVCSNAILKEELDRCMSGDTKDTVFGMLTEEYEYIAIQIHEAMKLFNGPNILINTLNVLSDSEVALVNQTYENIYKVSLSTDMDNYLTAQLNLKKVLKEELIPRDTSPADDRQADRDVQKILNAGYNGIPGTGTACDDYIEVFLRRSFDHLCLVFEKFYAETGADIKDQIRIDLEMDDAAKCFEAITDCVRDPYHHFAGAYNEIWGVLNDKDTLQQVLSITRCERDMINIKAKYEARYGETLANDVKSNNVGNYQYAILGLMGENNK